MNKRKTAIGVVVILLVAGTVWALVRNRPNPQVEKVKQMQADAFKEGATPEQRRESFDLIRKEMDKLSSEQRREVGHEMRQTFERQMDRQIATYFALPKEQRAAFLDKQINEMEKWRKAMESRRAQANTSSSQAGASGNSGQGRGNAGGQRPQQGRTSDERLQQRDRRLDRSTAEQRTLRSAFVADMNQRRIQLGLPPMTGRGPR
jgi:hypothetical protein